MSPQGYAPTLRLERYPGRGPAVRLVHGDGPAELAAYDGTPPRLVYIDPPFATDREFSLAHRLPEELGGREVERVAYSDRWGELDAYLDSANLRSLLGRPGVYEQAARAVRERLDASSSEPSVAGGPAERGARPSS